MQQKNFYTVLGIKKTASLKEIKTAYRNLAKKHHPDKNHDKGKAEDHFKEIQYAYAVLSNPHKRREYDLKTGPADSYTSSTAFRTDAPSPYSFAKTAAQAQKQASAKAPPPPTNKPKGLGVDYFPLIVSIIAALLFLCFIALYKM